MISTLVLTPYVSFPTRDALHCLVVTAEYKDRFRESRVMHEGKWVKGTWEPFVDEVSGQR